MPEMSKRYDIADVEYIINDNQNRNCRGTTSKLKHYQMVRQTKYNNQH